MSDGCEYKNSSMEGFETMRIIIANMIAGFFFKGYRLLIIFLISRTSIYYVSFYSGIFSKSINMPEGTAKAQ